MERLRALAPGAAPAATAHSSPTSAACSGCGKSLKIKAGLAGKKSMPPLRAREKRAERVQLQRRPGRRCRTPPHSLLTQPTVRTGRVCRSQRLGS